MRNLIIYLSLLMLTHHLSAVEIDKQTSMEKLMTAENMIDAFYSYDNALLLTHLKDAKESIPSVVFYQGWAEGGNYKVLKRAPCVVVKENTISCSITVQDDLMLALGIDFNVTDTFTLTFKNDKVIQVDTSSNDLDVFWQARDWVKANHAELIAKPCEGIWDGGPTPGDCVRAMVKGYALFSKSDVFPEKYRKN